MSRKITADPEFMDAGSGQNGWEITGGYQLKSTSPAIDSGILLPEHATKDYFGNPVPVNETVDRGAFEYQDSAQ